LATTGSTPNRRFTDAEERSATVIARGTFVRGDLAGSDPVDVRGTLEGDCRVSAHCTVREGARVLGNIDATALMIAGEVEAGTLTAEKIEIRASARVRATVRALRVAIADGALYEGDLQTQDPESGPLLFREKRKDGEPRS